MSQIKLNNYIESCKGSVMERSLRLSLALSLFAILLTAFFPATSLAQARGFVRKLSGSVTSRTGGALAKRAQLQNGEVISVSKGGSCTLALRANGSQYELPGGCTVQIGTTSIKRISGPDFKMLEPIDTGEWEDSMMSLPRLLGHLERASEDEASPYNLTPNGALLNPKITLKWKCPMPDVENVTFRLTLKNDSDRVVLRVDDIDPTVRSFVLPEDAMELGLWYEWKIEVVGGEHSGSKCSRMVRILPELERQALKKLEARVARGQSAHPPNHSFDLLLARQYKWSGFPEEAMKLYRTLLAANSADVSLRKEVELFKKSLEIGE